MLKLSLFNSIKVADSSWIHSWGVAEDLRWATWWVLAAPVFRFWNDSIEPLSFLMFKISVELEPFWIGTDCLFLKDRRWRRKKLEISTTGFSRYSTGQNAAIFGHFIAMSFPHPSASHFGQLAVIIIGHAESIFLRLILDQNIFAAANFKWNFHFHLSRLFMKPTWPGLLTGSPFSYVEKNQLIETPFSVWNICKYWPYAFQLLMQHC